MDKRKPLYLAVTLAILSLSALLLGAWTMGQPANSTESSAAQSQMGRTPSLRTDMALQVDSTEPTTETVPPDNAEMGQMMEEPTGMMDSSMPMTGSMAVQPMGDADMRQMMQMMWMMHHMMHRMDPSVGAMGSTMSVTNTMTMTNTMPMAQMMGMMMDCMAMMESDMGAMDSSMPMTSTMPMTGTAPMTATTPLESPGGSEDGEDSR